MTRQSQHNRSWSPLNDAWSGLARLRLMLISLRDDHRTKPSRERARHPQRRSERAACSMQARYPIYPKIKALAQREKAEIFFGDAAHMRSDHQAGRAWGKRGETPIVETTGARHRMSLISAITARGHMRFMIKEKGGVNAAVFIEFLKRLMAGAKRVIFLIVDRGPAHIAKKTKAFVDSQHGRLRLFFLPPYSPDRNPDELVWKHLKATAVRLSFSRQGAWR